MKKGFKFNFTLKVALSNGKFVNRNFMNYERAIQELLYYKNRTDARIGILFRMDNSISASFGIDK